MKKRGILFLLIVLLFVVILSIFSWINRKNTEVRQTFSDSILALDMEIGAAEIKIVTGDTFGLESSNPYITATEKRNTLVIREKPHIGSLENSVVTLSVPAGTILEDVEITTGAGKLQIEFLHCRELELELGAGMADIRHIIAERSADLKGGAGQILIHNSSLANLDFEMGVGEAEIFSLLTGNAEISAGIGHLALTIPAQPEDYTISAEGGIGNIEADGQRVRGGHPLGSGPNRIELEGGIGDISIYFEP